ncbi:MAG: IS630 family transposase [Acidobacteriota bacterium]|nr:IS630 family transposase [Acidobacteriota bacterium]
MRFGTRTDLGRSWTPSGVKTIGYQHIGYDYGYLSVAINPVTGEVKMLILPNMTQESFQVFLDEFAKDLKEETILITDGATAHRSKSLKPDEKINLELLPAYSPQLNPVERFFREVRRRLKNRVFTTYEEVEKAVIEIAKPFMKASEAIKKLTCYDWILNTPN